MPTMFALPWRWTRATRPERAVVFASRFDARGMRARWVLLGAGIRLGRAVLASPGALGVSLRAHPFAGRYYTLSMWQDQDSLLAFAHGDAHREAVRRITQTGPARGVLVSREVDCSRPRWGDTLRWVATAQPGRYRRHEEAAAGTSASASESGFSAQ